MFKNKQMVMYRNQLKYFEQVKNDLETRTSRVANLSYRKNNATANQRKLSK